jgi:hypothetical protein
MSRELVMKFITEEEDLDVLISCVELVRIYSLQKDFYALVVKHIGTGVSPQKAMKKALEDLNL